MTTKFTDLMTLCLGSMGDSDASTWPRDTRMLKWCIEAIQAFPILRPQLDDHTNGASDVYSLALPADFREVITVEYPISQQPPIYLLRKSRLDPDFYNDKCFYDIDHDYSAGVGWFVHFSAPIIKTTHVMTQYLATHNTAMADDNATLISVPDQYIYLLIAYVLAKGWRERLGVVMQDPTAHTSTILQMTETVHKAEQNYNEMVTQALTKLAESKITHAMKADRFDRVY
jgi:hypothetical protein